MKPVTGLRCPPTFPHGYQFVPAKTADEQELFGTIWRDGRSRGNNVVVTVATDPRASEARCIAIGPHRDLNLQNWCCR